MTNGISQKEEGRKLYRIQFGTLDWEDGTIAVLLPLENVCQYMNLCSLIP